MEELRELMYKSILVLGTQDKITVEISQRLDRLIVQAQRRSQYDSNR